MKSINELSYFIKEAFISFFRAGLMSFTAITTITISLAIFGFILIFSMNLKEFAKVLESQIDVTVYLRNDYNNETLEEMKKFLKSKDNIQQFIFVSKNDALEKLKKELGEEDFLITALDNNPLPDSIELKIKNSISVHGIIKELKKNFNIIDDVFYGQEIVEKVNKFTQVLRLIGTVLVVLLGIASMFIVSNTIKLTVYARRDEIEIMKLVGATNTFIRMPLIFEGVIQGLIGGLAATIIIGFSYPQIVDNMKDILPFIPFVTDLPELFKLYSKLVFSGVFLGIIGSLISVRKFLDV
ncbi:MAG: permease-like cell division protein FtsX [Candidatus Muirbacterium halophilum]|nr:permease-like cell division protein FtsX [Candidatus Muirbacterium halophilum]MCK9474919.1 permease-like cell division protein FtsX [Candidatus Muirbacterium halophilum]